MLDFHVIQPAGSVWRYRPAHCWGSNSLLQSALPLSSLRLKQDASKSAGAGGGGQKSPGVYGIDIVRNTKGKVGSRNLKGMSIKGNETRAQGEHCENARASIADNYHDTFADRLAVSSLRIRK